MLAKGQRRRILGDHRAGQQDSLKTVVFVEQFAKSIEKIQVNAHASQREGVPTNQYRCFLAGWLDA